MDNPLTFTCRTSRIQAYRSLSSSNFSDFQSPHCQHRCYPTASATQTLQTPQFSVRLYLGVSRKARTPGQASWASRRSNATSAMLGKIQLQRPCSLLSPHIVYTRAATPVTEHPRHILTSQLSPGCHHRQMTPSVSTSLERQLTWDDTTDSPAKARILLINRLTSHHDINEKT